MPGLIFKHNYMCKRLILFLLLLSYSAIHAQVSFFVFSSETKKPIPYVTIRIDNENEAIYTDESGKFALKTLSSEKRLIFSSVGYEKALVGVNEIRDTIFLKPKVVRLSEMIIVKKKNKRSLKFGKMEGEISQITDFTTIPNGGLYSVAKYFPEDRIFNEMPFLKRIKIRTHSQTKDTFLKVKLYTKGENGEPDGMLYDQDIIGEVKKGVDRILTIDVSKLDIILPSDGFFVAVERMIPEEEKMVTKEGRIISLKANGHGPGLIKVKDYTVIDTWMTNKGIWTKWKNLSAAIEIEVSN